MMTWWVEERNRERPANAHCPCRRRNRLQAGVQADSGLLHVSRLPGRGRAGNGLSVRIHGFRPAFQVRLEQEEGRLSQADAHCRR